MLLLPASRQAIGVALFLPDLVPSVAARPLMWVTRSPERRTVRFEAGTAASVQAAATEGSGSAVDSELRPTDNTHNSDNTDNSSGWDGELYLPAGPGPHPGLVIALGVTPAGRNDPRVVSLGDGLARLGVAAFVPYSPNLEQRRVTPDEIDFMVAAHGTLAALPSVDPARVGFFGLCVGASLSALAAGDPRIADDVAVLGWFGGYHDLARLVASVASESYMDDGAVVPWTPDTLAREVVGEQLLSLLDEDERRAVELSVVQGVPPADVDEALGRTFSPRAHTVLALLNHPDYPTSLALLEALPAKDRALLATLSPTTRAAAVRAPVFVMSDTGDTLIPHVETDALASALGARVQRRTVFTVFSHVDLDRLDEPLRVARELAALHAQVRGIAGTLR